MVNLRDLFLIFSFWISSGILKDFECDLELETGFGTRNGKINLEWINRVAEICKEGNHPSPKNSLWRSGNNEI